MFREHKLTEKQVQDIMAGCDFNLQLQHRLSWAYALGYEAAWQEIRAQAEAIRALEEKHRGDSVEG